MHGDVIEGRECGSCNVCCVALTIDDPALQKVQGYRCPHLTRAAGCGIYAVRPGTCRTFQCGWRVLKWVKQTLRPDRSNVLIRMKSGPHATGIAITLLDRAALKAEGLAETVAAAVAAGAPVFVDIPGPPGYTSAVARVDEVLVGAVAARDKPAVLAVLRKALQQGRSGPRVPIKIGSDQARPG